MLDRKRDTEKESRSGSEPMVLPDPTKSPAKQDSLVLLAMCVFGEARGEIQQVRRAVAQTIINRAKYPHPVFGSRRGLSFAENVRRVILQPQQFSSLNPDDPNYRKLLRPMEHEEPAVWDECLRCAQEALAAKYQADTLTANSDHYFDDSIQPPIWADPAKQTVKIGRLNFYRLYLPSDAKALEGTPSEALRSKAFGRQAALAQEGEPPPNPSRILSPLGSPRGAGLVEETKPPEPSPAVLSRPHTSLPASAHATVRTIGLSQHRWENRGGWLASRPTLKLWTACRPQPWRRRACPPTPCGLEPSGVRAPWHRGACPPEPWHRGACPPEPWHRGACPPEPWHRGACPPEPWRRRACLALLALSLVLAGCTDFERAAYRTLATTQVEYETLQEQAVEAALDGLLTEEQWDRFATAGHRFIHVHNAAVEAFAAWSQTKNKKDAARLEAMLTMLPRMIREINELVQSFEQESGGRNQEPADSSAPSRSRL